jgi:Alpha/beta hydrolase family
MQLTPVVHPGREPCPETELPAGFIDPPARFVEAGHEMRLIPSLRAAGQMRNPYQVLARSAAAFFRAQNPTAGSVPADDAELGNALADLAVTGRRHYCLLATPPRTPLHDALVAGGGPQIDLGTAPYTASELEAKVGELLAPLVSATPAQSARAVNAALDRAFRVAWALRGPVAERTATRAALGWIATSGEDDMPHRPTNVPAPTYEQYEIPVTVPGTRSRTAVTLQTRFVIASPLVPASPRAPHTLRELPPEPVPEVPTGNNVILFLHGHMSGVEEALTIIPDIHRAGLARGTKFSIISVDLPNCGYSESFHHERIAPSRATEWPTEPIDREPIRTPVLDFIEDFVVAFVDALDQITPIKGRFAGVIGGSLGGNLGLRLGRRRPMPAWLDTGIVSWNAASVWNPMVNDHLKSKAPRQCRDRWEASELDDSRKEYFHQVYDSVVIPIILPLTQPELWYRPAWAPCKKLHIMASRMARQEVYSANLRRWHWRVAGEQLIYSHRDRVDRWDSTTPYRYELNVVKQLLIGSAADNFAGSNIFDATRQLADKMATTPGTSLFLAATGHSVHSERPRYLAKKIVDFLPRDPTPPAEPTRVLSLEITSTYREERRFRRSRFVSLGRILAVYGINHTDKVDFAYTVEECVKLVDFGCDVFVSGGPNGRIPVHVVRSGGRAYIATNPDASGGNNLHSLPAN